jgi:NAD(P)-dependent dehydrogenase (short-subunit alcohol dehydrogenase family)
VAGRLEGKTAIVTGAGSRGPGVGTGKAMSVLFAREGARVCLVDREPERAEETLATIAGEGGEAFVVAADVSSGSDCERIVADTVARWGRLDVLVNNVGIVPAPAPPHEVEEEDWDLVLTVNLKSVLLMTKHGVPRMIEGGGGSIVNISSTGALISTGQTSAYGASKAAIIRLTADTAVAYGRAGVRANAIAPGFIYTPLVSDQTAQSREDRRRATPLGIEGDAWDIAWTALFLASDEARYVTGACIPVDGGLTQVSPLKSHQLIGDGS